MDKTNLDNQINKYLYYCSDIISLISKYNIFSQNLTNENAKEHGLYGIGRRLVIIRRCLQNISTISPPGRNNHLSADERIDLTIQLHGYYVHIFGGLNNLAWLLYYQKEIYKVSKKLKRDNIGLFNNKFRKYLSDEFCKQCDNCKDWYDGFCDFRHPLAHRVPFYIPPSQLSRSEAQKYVEIFKKAGDAASVFNFEEYERLHDEADLLGKYVPGFIHSFKDGSPFKPLHETLLNDIDNFLRITNLVFEYLKEENSVSK